MEKLRKVGQALKEKLDETAQNRVLERQRKQQEDEAAEKAIELEVRSESGGRVCRVCLLVELFVVTTQTTWVCVCVCLSDSLRARRSCKRTRCGRSSKSSCVRSNRRSASHFASRSGSRPCRASPRRSSLRCARWMSELLKLKLCVLS